MATPQEVAKEWFDVIEMFFDETPNQLQVVQIITEGMEGAQFGYKMFQDYEPKSSFPAFGLELAKLINDKYNPLTPRETT